MALSQTQVSQLFVSLFNRASEGNGNAFYQTPGVPEFENMTKAATYMLTLQVVKDYFGPSFDNNQAFVELIFKNTLNRVPADGQGVRDGIAFWVGALDGTLDGNIHPRGEVVASLIGAIYDYGPGGSQRHLADAATIAAYNQFTNRVEVSNYLADNQWETLLNYETITRFGAEGGFNVTDDPGTVAAAKARVDVLAAEKVSIDTGTLEAPVTFDAGTGAFNFTDNASVLSCVVINHFTFNDHITISNAQETDYSFSNDGTDVNISYNNNGTMNMISLIGVVSNSLLVYDQASFEAAIGFDAFTN